MLLKKLPPNHLNKIFNKFLKIISIINKKITIKTNLYSNLKKIKQINLNKILKMEEEAETE